MEFFELIHQRQSIRKWQDKPIDSTTLNGILEAVRLAPSAGNFQSYEVYVANSAEQRQKLAAATWDQGFIADAPVILAFCSHAARCEYPGAETYALEDTTIACTFAMLSVTELGLGAVWIGAFDPKRMADVLSLPPGQVPVALLPIGYANESSERTSRRKLTEFVHELS
jgi:nitroreductase